ncbi:hypothetical protein [Micromonospora endophytica]|uniref:Uncharacterized protein n=1 Tax=Micromonospora endophytica TaxID=515350 RepID=A0A2W2C686_9ACTN|nr:hypothetical protein [Micromonospora endophytica]PZF94911.1 hypothetical protein C1I93_16065 [Micromonospora endophytica]RIW47366.1 hypothetical protein D3H59_10135 [Micromonospora endophytica]BCJ60847.1 hypothetical protein Jiend_42690 [Micromonospora endophytica]
MGLFRRRPKLPPAARPPLERDERVLAWAAAGNGEGDGVVVASNLGLWLPGRSHRLGWHEIVKAVWSGRELSVTPGEQIAERDGYLVVADRPVERHLLLDPGELPHQVRARVTQSVAYTQHHTLPGGGARIVARRVPGIDGLTWTVHYDPETPTDTDSVVAETAHLVATARTSTTPTDL